MQNVYTKNIESQPEYWAREIEWAVNELIKDNKPLCTSRIMKLTNMRLRDIEVSVSYIQNQEIQELARELLSYHDIQAKENRCYNRNTCSPLKDKKTKRDKEVKMK